MICRWLELATEQWPPDYYSLLGLRRGDANLARIEANVQDRLKRVRCYQIANPELATEAMNRLAEAYVCLTDPKARQAYDAELGLPAPSTQRETKRPPRSEVAHDTVTNSIPTVVALGEPKAEATVPPNPADAANQPAVSPPSREPEPPSQLASPPAPQAPVPPRPRIRASRLERRGLGTRTSLYQRVLFTRDLLDTWRRLGKYLKHPGRKLTRTGEERDLLRGLQRVDHLLTDFPAFVGRPGKGGYRIAILARDENPIRAFGRMDVLEREALALDWVTGMNLLRSHQNYLRQEIKQRRKQPWVCKVFRPTLAYLESHERWILVALLVLLMTGTGILFLLAH
jgi:hypothetical protein